jgi:PEP-CTERM motif
MSKTLIRSSVAAVAMAASMAASATIVTVFDSIPAGTASYNATVAAAGGTVTALAIPAQSGNSIVASDFTITRNNGGFISTTTYGTMSGPVVDISPSGSGPGIGAIGSGIKFTFNTAVNSIGFEVGDWGTCCQPSALFISFDGGAPIQVGKSVTGGDVFFGNKAEVFVAAFDDTGNFSTVQFWGDGFGEYLVAGGRISYALLQQGSLPPTGNVPEPAGLALAGLALAGVFAARKRKQQA